MKAHTNALRLITEDPGYNDLACYQRFCCKIEFAVVKKLDRTHLKHQKMIVDCIF